MDAAKDWAPFIREVRDNPELREELRSALSPSGSRFPEANKFRNEVREYCNQTWQTRSGKDSSGYRLNDAFNTLLKFRLRIKSVAALTDEQVPEARKLFDQYKQLLTMN